VKWEDGTSEFLSLVDCSVGDRFALIFEDQRPVWSVNLTVNRPSSERVKLAKPASRFEFGCGTLILLAFMAYAAGAAGGILAAAPFVLLAAALVMYRRWKSGTERRRNADLVEYIAHL
jgi:hypothetical protein